MKVEDRRISLADLRSMIGNLDRDTRSRRTNAWTSPGTRSIWIRTFDDIGKLHATSLTPSSIPFRLAS